MRVASALFVAVLWVALAPPAMATPDAVADREIRHLLDFVGASGCTFIRNGDPHASKDAAEHLLMKYERAQSRLKTAEQFIDKVASGSYLTGQEYRVQCAGRAEMATAEWLRAELAAARASGEGEQAGK